MVREKTVVALQEAKVLISAAGGPPSRGVGKTDETYRVMYPLGDLAMWAMHTRKPVYPSAAHSTWFPEPET